MQRLDNFGYNEQRTFSKKIEVSENMTSKKAESETETWFPALSKACYHGNIMFQRES